MGVRRRAKQITRSDLCLPWWQHQRDWLNDESRFRVCCKSRQIGMSTTVAAEALNCAMWGGTTVVVSASQRQARELIRKASLLLPIITVGAGGMISVCGQSKDALELSTGGRIVSVPASAATMQGFTGNVVLDEAAWIPNIDDVWQAIVPTISMRDTFRLSVISTPASRSGVFHRLWHSEAAEWSKHRVDVYDACRNGAPHNIAELRAAVADEVTWRAAYECEFVDESYALLPYELLTTRTDSTLNYHLDHAELEDGPLFAGYDVGRKRDLSVLVVLRGVGGAFEWVGAVELDKTPFDQQYALIESVVAQPALARLQIDQSGLGMQLAEELSRNHKVEPVTMTMPVKQAMASLTLATLQRGRLNIPDHRPLLDDLHSVNRIITPSGNVRYTASHDSGSHADRWTALALALQAGTGSVIGPFDFDAAALPVATGMRDW